MQGLTASWLTRFSGRDAGRSRRAAILTGSLAFHAVVLGWLALSALGLESRYAPTSDETLIPLWIEPRPLLPGETARTSVRPTPTSDRAATAPGDPPRTAPAETPPAPPTPRLAAAPPADAPAPPDDPWRVRPEDADSAMGRALRGGTMGCRMMAGRLSPAEQAVCDQRLGAAAARAGPPGPRALTAAEARREAGFARDGARALAHYEAQRAPLGSGVGVVGPADCVGSNFGVGCAGAHLDPAIRQEGRTNLRQDSNKIDGMRPIPGND